MSSELVIDVEEIARGGKTAVPGGKSTSACKIPPTRHPPIRIILNSPTAARRTLARVTRATAHGTIDQKLGSTLTYMIQTLMNGFRTEQETDILRRMEAIERAARGEEPQE